MFILYDLIIIILAIVYLPCLFLKGKLHRGILQRLGFLPINSTLKKPIWIHAVSVGEARLAQILLKQLREKYPQKNFVLSTVTPTGNRIVQGFLGKEDYAFYLPLDISFITRRVIKKIDPCICIIIETEIWPNLITHLDNMGTPVILINARISDSSFLGYRLIKFLIKPVLNKINLFCVQGARDAQRLSVLGVCPDKLRITGNMKYDLINSLNSNIDDTDYRLRLGLVRGEQLFVAGSTHPGEEEMILNAYSRLVGEFPQLRLLIAPRHPRRASEIEALICRFGFAASRISKLGSSVNNESGVIPRAYDSAQTVFILDTIGELMPFYAIANVVFVGGSLVKRGGHNILEPAIFEKATLFGPHMFNFREISRLFLSQGASRMVRNKEELFNQIKLLLKNHSELVAMGKRAKHIVLENQGATRKNVQNLSLFIGHG